MPDPIGLEPGFPKATNAVIRAVFIPAVDAFGVVRTQVTFGGGWDRRGLLGFPAAAGCQVAMVFNGVRFSADRA